MIMDRLYGGVCYAGIDTDPELKYPKGAGRVAFSNQQSYIAAISARFVQLQHGDIDKRVSNSCFIPVRISSLNCVLFMKYRSTKKARYQPSQQNHYKLWNMCVLNVSVWLKLCELSVTAHT